MENLQLAFMLMIVGMATVFVILLVVIYMGKALITAVNTLFPEEVAPAKPQRSTAPTQAIPDATMAAITAAMQLATNGKAHIVKVEKL